MIWSAYEAKKIDNSFYEDRMLADVFGNNEIQIEGEDDEDELAFELLEMVRITSGDYSQRCYVEKFKEDKVLVLEPVNNDESWVFMVEKDKETGKWHDIEDTTVREELLLAYCQNNKPECMEVVE